MTLFPIALRNSMRSDLDGDGFIRRIVPQSSNVRNWLLAVIAEFLSDPPDKPSV